MQVLIDIKQPLPRGTALSYGALQFSRYGVMRWMYNGYADEVVWINAQKFMNIARYPNPTSLQYWFAPGTIAEIQLVPGPSPNIPDVVINGAPYNPLTGLNVPLILAS